MAISVLSPTLGLNRSIADSRDLLADLQKQIATRKKIQTYGDLGNQRSQILSTRSEFSQIKGYTDTIKLLDVRLDISLKTLEGIRTLASKTKSDTRVVGFKPTATGQTGLQTAAALKFDEVASLLNTEVNGRHLFGGRETERNPVLPVREILDGAGARAGFKQVVSERRQADLGADGLGRLVLAGPEASVLGGVAGTPGDIGGAAAAQVTIDIGGNPKNFDISDGGLDTLAGLKNAINTAFGADVASIVGGNQLKLTATNSTDTITITDIDAGAAALAGLTAGATANPTATATITEDSATSPFGFKLDTATSTLTGATVSGPAGSPASVGVQFTSTLPKDGDTIRLTFDLPDGTTNEMILTARSSAPLAAGEFLIGADENATAANFQTVLTTSIKSEAQQSLSAASLFEAADNFFDFDASNPPQRVSGPPFNTSAALVNGTTADTVFWYQGEDSATDARSSNIAQVDDSISVSYGVRANEGSLRGVLKTFAALSTEVFAANDVNASDRYSEIRLRANSALSFQGGAQPVEDIINEVAVAKVGVGRASERHKASNSILKDIIGDAENSDLFEVSAQLLSLRTRVQASLQISASLSRLSILNFL